jgi:hypothetical protein
MTSVTFPFFVGLPGDDKKIPLLDAEFRFTTKTTRAMERAAGAGISWVIAKGQSVEALVLLVCYGLQWKKWPKGKALAEMTEDWAVDLIDAFIDADGEIEELSKAVYKALDQSGVYGKPKAQDGDVPLATTTTSSPAAA